MFEAGNAVDEVGSTRERAIRLVDFLHGVRALGEPPIRDIATYSDKRWWEYDLPEHQAVLVGPGATGDGSWLRVVKTELEPVPQPPELCRPWVLPAATPMSMQSPELDEARLSEVVEEQDAQLIRAFFATWVRETWTRWCERTSTALAARRLYEDLFDLRNRLKRDEAIVELVWGHGILTWSVARERVCCPITTTALQVAFNPATGALSIEPAGETRMELDMLGGLGLGGYDALVARRERFRAEPADMWEPIEAREVYEHFLGPLGLDTRITDAPVAVAAETPVIVATSALFVRKRKTMYQRYFELLRERLLSDAAPPPPVAAVVADEPTTMLLPGDGERAATWAPVGERLLMPLPTNDEQERIARQLAVNRGVTVQGPPGTGKTHTIANLICHLIAHGKRVLVTSHKEQPLTVLRDKLPEDLRPLCVSVLGASSGSLGQLEHSVQQIYTRGVALDRDRARSRMQELDNDLDSAHRKLAELRSRIRTIVENESKTYTLGTRTLTAAELARWLAEHESELGFIPDRIAEGVECPLDPDALTQLYRLSAVLDPEDAAESQKTLPDPESLPTGAQIVDAYAQRREIRDRLAAVDIAYWEGIDALGRDGLASLVAGLREATDRLGGLEAEWLIRLRNEICRNPVQAGVWFDHAKLLREGINEILTWRAELGGHTVRLPFEGMPTKDQISQLEILRDRYAAGKGVSRLRHRDLLQVRESSTVDEEPPRSAEDVDLLLVSARMARRRFEIVQRWNSETARLGGPIIPTDLAYPEDELDVQVSTIDGAILWENQRWAQLSERITEAGLTVEQRPTSQYLRQLAEIVDVATDRFVEQDLEAWLAQVCGYLDDQAARPDASRLWSQLIKAIASHDGARWDAALGEARQLVRMRSSADRRRDLLHRLSTVTPAWCTAIESSRATECGPLERVPEAWNWRQADTWLSDLIASDDPSELQRRTEEQQRRVQTVTVELANESAWLALAESLTDKQRQALTSWTDALRRIGKGTGKYAPRWRAVAQAAMRDAVDAVPVWIMPTYRAVESIDPLHTAPFDVVITDESSQCDLFSLAVLGIAEKAVVVGDDKQISPQAVGSDQSRVHDLINEHISDIPGAQLFNLQESLYNIAKRTFPGVIMLREHFRCVPEIIQFSNDLCYGGDILPLREVGTPLPQGPIVTRRLNDGFRDGQVNRPEAEAIVEAIVECCGDDRYRGLTMGVISLLGQEQAQLIDSMLVTALGEREIEARDLRCGDAYNFQGDERNIMFLSLVTARDEKHRAAFTKESDRQRINVAASRARDQMWVFHSVDPDELHLDDVRARLLRYCLDPARMSEDFRTLAERCESDFERDVLRELTSRGYAMRVQHRVGQFRIDMVVEGINDRLAVECDGDSFHGPDRWEADRQRQAILERLGWKFSRIRASAYYRDAVRALAPVLERLESLGVYPSAIRGDAAAFQRDVTSTGKS